MEKSDDLCPTEGKQMAPKNNHDPLENSATKVEEADLQEMQAVSQSLDELSDVLDFFEARTDNIIAQLKELLHSNREIRQELALENAAAEADANNMDIDTEMEDDRNLQ